MLFGGAVNSHPTLKTLLMLPVKPYDLYWYLYTLILLYLIFSLDKIRMLPPKILLPAFTAVNLIGGRLIPGDVWFQLRSVCYYLIFFYMGILLRKYKDSKFFSVRPILIFGAVAGVFCVLFWNSKDHINSIWGVNLAVGMGLSLLLLFLFENFPVLGNCRLLQLYGKHALEVYLFHSYFVSILRTLDRRFGFGNVYIATVLCFVIPSACVLCFAVVCEKLKLSGLLFRPAFFLRDVLRSRRTG